MAVSLAARSPSRLLRQLSYLCRRHVLGRHQEYRIASADRSRPLVHLDHLASVLLDGSTGRRGTLSLALQPPDRHELTRTFSRRLRTISTREPMIRIGRLARGTDPSISFRVERLLHYANKLEREAPAVIEDNRPPESWPAGGAIEFKNVVMSYRPDLPPVLKGLNLSVRAGEKIGVRGRHDALPWSGSRN